MNSTPPLIIILLGPPGSGKGTQAALIQEKLQLPHISTGDLLRNHIREQSPVGSLAKQFIDKGQLVPDDLIVKMLFEEIEDSKYAKGYILDGFPRTLPQAETLETFLKTPPTVLNLDLADNLVIERLSLRVSCAQCGRPYHLLYSPPHTPDHCDKCGGNLVQRSDDRKEIILKRLEVYHKQTKPLIQFYTERKELHTIDCNATKEEVFTEALKKLQIK